VLQTAASRAKIQGPSGWHTLRHSYRAWLDEAGAPLGVQQKLMRHANISTMMSDESHSSQRPDSPQGPGKQSLLNIAPHDQSQVSTDGP